MTPDITPLLTAYPIVLEIPVAWGDMDAFQHVNNTIYFRWFESARLAYFEVVGITASHQQTGIGAILASASCGFRLPLTYPDTISVGVRARELQADRFRHEYIIVSHRHAKVAAQGDGMIVMYDYNALTKAPIPDAVRAAIVALENGRGGRQSAPMQLN